MKASLGTNLRTLRRRKGLTQTNVATRLGISPSYLNLIEHDQRQLPANLLIKAAEILNVELAAFSDDSQNRLAADLQEVFGDPLFEEHALTTADLRELADNPAASRAVIALYHAYRATVESRIGQRSNRHARWRRSSTTGATSSASTPPTSRPRRCRMSFSSI